MTKFNIPGWEIPDKPKQSNDDWWEEDNWGGLENLNKLIFTEKMELLKISQLLIDRGCSIHELIDILKIAQKDKSKRLEEKLEKQRKQLNNNMFYIKF